MVNRNIHAGDRGRLVQFGDFSGGEFIKTVANADVEAEKDSPANDDLVYCRFVDPGVRQHLQETGWDRDNYHWFKYRVKWERDDNAGTNG
jgi:hypothetical protein